MFIRSFVPDTVYRVADIVKETCPKRESNGHTWYNVQDQHLEAEVTLLRQSGVIARHPLVNTLIRFEERS